MKKRSGKSNFRLGFLGFGKKPGGMAKVAGVLDERARNDDFRFLLSQLSFQSKYVPGLTKLHNDMILAPVFHERKFRLAKNVRFGIPVITGIVSEDAKLLLNAHRMRVLEGKINKQRVLGVRVFGKKGFEAALVHINKARDFEKQFNDLKEKNLLVFIKRFGKSNRP